MMTIKTGSLKYMDENGQINTVYPKTNVSQVEGIFDEISQIYYGDGPSADADLINADLLNGKPASYYEELLNSSNIYMGDGTDSALAPVNAQLFDGKDSSYYATTSVATTSTDGLMSSSDKSKLDGMGSACTQDQIDAIFA